MSLVPPPRGCPLAPEQVDYELIRPVVLLGLSVTDRAAQTGAAPRTLARNADRDRRPGLRRLAPAGAVRVRLVERQVAASDLTRQPRTGVVREPGIDYRR